MRVLTPNYSSSCEPLHLSGVTPESYTRGRSGTPGRPRVVEAAAPSAGVAQNCWGNARPLPKQGRRGGMIHRGGKTPPESEFGFPWKRGEMR